MVSTPTSFCLFSLKRNLCFSLHTLDISNSFSLVSLEELGNGSCRTKYDEAGLMQVYANFLYWSARLSPGYHEK